MRPARHALVPPRRAALGLLAACALYACGGGPAPASETPAASRPGEADPGAPHTTDIEDAPATSARLRRLGVGATFGDLVASVRALDAADLGASASGCLLRGGGLAPFVFEGDLASAVHPLPEAPRELASRLDDPRTSVTVLTRWAQHGGEAPLTLVALTSTPPPGPGPLAVVVLTREGALLRLTEGAVPAAHAGPFPPTRLGEHAAVVAERAAGIVVSAEAGIPLDSLRSALGAIPSGGPPVLIGLALEAGVRLPASPGADPSVHGMCVDDALPLPPPNQSLGALPTDVLRARVANMAEGAMRCFEYARGDAARGGRMRVLTRIDRAGRVTEACASSDDLGDPTLRACVLGVVRGLVFPALPEGDYVDVALPLRLVPDTSERQRPLCDH